MTDRNRPQASGLPTAVRASLPLEDDAAFRAALAGVRPLHHDTVDLRPPAPPPVPTQSRRDQRSVLEEMMLMDPGEGEMETGDELIFKRDGVQNSVMRKLRRGQYAIQGHIDLHGLTTPEAKIRLATFLLECFQRGHRCVRIVHGKGLRSPGQIPVLKPKVSHWLSQRDEVLAFISTPAADGGTGAIYVLLKGLR